MDGDGDGDLSILMHLQEALLGSRRYFRFCRTSREGSDPLTITALGLVEQSPSLGWSGYGGAAWSTCALDANGPVKPAARRVGDSWRHQRIWLVPSVKNR